MKKSTKILFLIFVCLLLNACNIGKHRINFTTLEEIEPILSGKGLSNAADYDPATKVIPRMVILDVNGEYNKWNDDLQDDWRSENVEDVELVIVVEEKVECVDVEHLDKTNPTSPYIYFYQHDLFVKVYEAYTGNILKTTILEGPEHYDPFQNPMDGNRVDYDPVSFDQLKVWLGANSKGLLDSFQVMFHGEMIEEDYPLGTDGIEDIAFSSDGEKLASGKYNHDDTIRIWKVEDGSQVDNLALDTFVGSIEFSPDDRILASGTINGNIVLWGMDDGLVLDTLHNGHGWPVFDVTFSPDGKMLASASNQTIGGKKGVIQLWRVDDGSLLSTLDDTDVSSIDFSPDGELLAVCANNQIGIINVNDGTLKNVIEQKYVQFAVFSPNGKIIASASHDDYVYLWQVESGELLAKLEGHENFIDQLAFSPNGKILASASVDHTVKLWDLEEGTVIHTLQHGDWVTSVAFSPQGDSLATGSKNNLVLIWELDRWIED